MGQALTPFLTPVSQDSSNKRYGSRLLPQVVDELAHSDPERIYASIPHSPDLSHGFRDVSMLQVSRAVDRVARWLESVAGRSTQFETLCYVGPSDLRYALIFLAAVKCGYKLLVPSIRNSTWMNASLMEQTQCKKFLYAIEISSKVQSLQAAVSDLQTWTVESLDDMLQGESEQYAYKATYEQARWDPVLVLHSSGSTGPPKPVVMNHATWAVVDNDRNFATVKGRRNQNFALFDFPEHDGRYYAAFPPFHLGGFVTYVCLPIFSITATVVLGPADRPPTGQIASQIMRIFEIRAIFCPPTIYEQLVQEEGWLERAKDLDFILYAGGPLLSNTGNRLSQVTNVCQFYGSTEAGGAQTLVTEREDWEYLEWHPGFGADMQPSEDEAFELVLHREPKFEGIRFLDCNFPHMDEWHTKDLFRSHPNKPNLWKFHGRLDDIIVLSNGLKFNPIPSEAIIGAHPLLLSALVVGQGRFLAALLVEPKDSEERSAENLIKEIWPTVEEANARAPGQARIVRSMILVASQDKMFTRAGKGTVIRGMTARNFAAEIETLYSIGNLVGTGPTLTVSDDWDHVREYVRACIELSFQVEGLSDNQDLYVSGLDSLKTIEISTTLRAGIKESDTAWFSPQSIYTHPSILKLTRLIFENLNSGDTRDRSRIDAKEPGRTAKMASLVDKFTCDLMTQRNVLLTGSTGSLGTHLLRTLITDRANSKIICLNRSADALDRQTTIYAKLGLDFQLKSSSRIEFIQADYGKANLGLSEPRYQELVSSIDVIIHNAWKVDFNHSLESFEEVHIQGVRHMIDFCQASPAKPHLIFLSSVSSVGLWNKINPAEPVPEDIISDFEAAQQMGYAESKLVSENILHRASEALGLATSILRIGQVAGPVESAGVWNEHEWLPSLLKTSKSLGALPDYLPDPDWIPVDMLASIILEIAQCPTPEGKAAVYNVVNPRATSWTSLAPSILEHLGSNVRIVHLDEWLQLLEGIKTADLDLEELESKPAAKILEFLRRFATKERGGQVQYSTAKALATSETMRALMPVNPRWMELWLKQWGY